MKIETEKLARKPLKEYDTNQDGKIDAKETSIFKEDCNKLYAAAYGEDSQEYKSLSKRLEQSTINFKDMSDQGGIANHGNDFENHKYNIDLPTRGENNSKLKDSKITLTDIAGILVHEEEHIQQQQSVYDQVRKDKGSANTAKRVAYSSYCGNLETFAEIERMNFYKKLGTFSFADKSDSYKKYIEESSKIEANPSTDKKTFLEKFNFAEFAKTVKERYESLDFNDKKDEYGLKNLLFE